MKCYTVRKGGETHRVYFCRECHTAFEKAAQSQDGKAGKAVKGVVKGLEAIGMIVMMVIFALTLVTLKLIMTKKSGDGGDDGDGENSGFGSGKSSFFGGGDGSDGGEPMLGDFNSGDLMGYEVSDEAGQVFQTDDLVNQLYSDEGAFSEGGSPFLPRNQTFSSDAV
jgi:hypothetical protein